MMSTTHAVMGAALTLPLVAVTPTLAPVAALAAFVGGLVPDADAVVGRHRRTLHHPELFTGGALVAGAAAVVVPGTWTVAAAALVGSAALHSVVDVFGGGLALRPWEEDDHRGIYLHTRGRWLPPRKWVRYDGAPEDLLLAVALGVPVAVVHGGPLRALTAAGLVGSAAYAAGRRRLVDAFPGFFEE